MEARDTGAWAAGAPTEWICQEMGRKLLEPFLKVACRSRRRVFALRGFRCS